MDSGITRKYACIFKKAYKAFLTKHTKNFFPILSLDRFPRIQEGELNQRKSKMQGTYFHLPSSLLSPHSPLPSVSAAPCLWQSHFGRSRSDSVLQS